MSRAQNPTEYPPKACRIFYRNPAGILWTSDQVLSSGYTENRRISADFLPSLGRGKGPTDRRRTDRLAHREVSLPKRSDLILFKSSSGFFPLKIPLTLFDCVKVESAGWFGTVELSEERVSPLPSLKIDFKGTVC